MTTALESEGAGLTEAAADLWEQALVIWGQGGWAMVAIGAIALFMFFLGLNVFFRLTSTGFRSVPEKKWRRWIEHPEERRGPIGRILDNVLGGRTLEDTAQAFDEIRKRESAPFERDLLVMKVCVSASPLVGLLGTVMGMLTTFDALSSGSGGDKTMGMIAAGISEALITTETGLVVALPGLFFQYLLRRYFEAYKAFLAHLESITTQHQYRRFHQRDHELIERAARREIARKLKLGLIRHRAPAPARA